MSFQGSVDMKGECVPVAWNTRFVQLDPTLMRLNYWKGGGDGPPLGFLDLKSATLLIEAASSFQLKTKSGSYHFRGGDMNTLMGRMRDVLPDVPIQEARKEKNARPMRSGSGRSLSRFEASRGEDDLLPSSKKIPALGAANPRAVSRESLGILEDTDPMACSSGSAASAPSSTSHSAPPTPSMSGSKRSPSVSMSLPLPSESLRSRREGFLDRLRTAKAEKARKRAEKRCARSSSVDAGPVAAAQPVVLFVPNTKISPTEEDSAWLAGLAIEDDPEQRSEMIRLHVKLILSMGSLHPFGAMVDSFVERFNLCFRGSNSGLSGDKDAHDTVACMGASLSEFVDHVVSAMHRTYPTLLDGDGDVSGASGEGAREDLRLCIEDAVHPRVHHVIFPAYEALYKRRDLLFRAKILAFASLPADVFGVDPKFVLDDREGSPGDISVNYERPIALFRSLRGLCSPIEKLNKLVEVSKSICTCVEEYYAKKADYNKRVVMGADDIMPVFVNCFVKSKARAPFAEAAYLCDLTDEMHCLGAEGYLLATFQACLDFLERFEPPVSEELEEGERNTNEMKLKKELLSTPESRTDALSTLGSTASRRSSVTLESED